MAYTAEISRTNPACFLFLIDQSGSMGDNLPNGISKAQQVADTLNKTIEELIVRCNRQEGTRDYFHIGVIGYGYYRTFEDHGVINALQTKNIISPISEVEQVPIRVESRNKRVSDGAGGLVDVQVKFPVWVDPYFNGGTPMVAALQVAAQEIAAWIDQYPNAYPPVILHITDGESGDGDPEDMAQILREMETNDGNVLLFNLHTSDKRFEPIRFPANENGLGDEYARMLFRMSSVLPKTMIDYARSIVSDYLSEGSRGFMFNAKADDIVNFLEIGTRAAQIVPDQSLM